MEPLSDLHRAAREYAAAGRMIFPCIAGTKRPATDHGFHDASSDVSQIDAWWTEDPAYNIAFSPDTEDLAVVDIDGQEGQETWNELTLSNPFPTTMTVATPHGTHYYFVGLLPPSVSLLGPHVDTRGRGSYALLPPSRLTDGGTYSWSQSLDPAPLPSWITELLERNRPQREKARHERLDDPANVARFRQFLLDQVAAGRVAIEGQNGDKRTYVTACQGFELGLTAETVLDLLLSNWNEHCIPPWDADELRTKVENAERYAQNETGAWATASGAEAFGSVLDTLGLQSEPQTQAPRRKRFAPVSYAELRSRPPPAWLIPGRLPDKRVTMLYGPPGTYKSFLALDDALTLACLGRSVVYVAGEGVLGTTQRITSWELARQTPVDGLPFHLIEDMPFASRPDDCVAFCEAVRGLAPDLLVIDTVRRAMLELNENDARDMGKMVEVADLFKQGLNCAVLLIHHTRKDGKEAAGSGALLGGTDAAIEVVTADPLDTKRPAVALWVRRMKDAREAEKPFCYQGHEIGESLAFNSISYDAFKQLNPKGQDHGPGELEVRAVLLKAGITAPALGIGTRALASLLHVPHPDETPEQLAANLDRYTRLLTKRVDHLSGLWDGDGNERRWFVPA